MARRAQQTEERREIFSPAERSRITREFLADVKAENRKGGRYHGTKLGTQYELNFQPEQPVAPFAWRVCRNRHWQEGFSIDVYHALGEIAGKIENKEWDKRLERIQAEELGRA